MLKKTIYYPLLFFFFLYPLVAHSQLFDSIKAYFAYTPRVDVRLDTRNSFITTQAAKIMGIKVGLVYNHTIRVGVGYNLLRPKLYKQLLVRDENNIQHLVDGELIFTYFAPYFEYTFYRKGQWDVNIPLQLGIGSARYEYNSTIPSLLHKKNKMVLVYEATMIVQYKIITWFAVGLGTGYRLLLVGNNVVDENFNSPIYAVKLNLLIGDLYRTVFPDKNNDPIKHLFKKN